LILDPSQDGGYACPVTYEGQAPVDVYPKYQLPSGNWTTDVEYADRLWAKTRGTSVDAQVMFRYRAAKDAYDRLVVGLGPKHVPGRPWPPAVYDAAACVRAMKDEAGEGLPGDPLCCQRYGRLHLPEFSVSGCRWYPLLMQGAVPTGCGIHPAHRNPFCQTGRAHAPAEPPHWTEETDRAAAELFKTLSTDEIRLRQGLAASQIRLAWEQKNERALADLRAMEDALTREMFRRTDPEFGGSS
jgi:hypothetical protein